MVKNNWIHAFDALPDWMFGGLASHLKMRVPQHANERQAHDYRIQHTADPKFSESVEGISGDASGDIEAAGCAGGFAASNAGSSSSAGQAIGFGVAPSAWYSTYKLACAMARVARTSENSSAIFCSVVSVRFNARLIPASMLEVASDMDCSYGVIYSGGVHLRALRLGGQVGDSTRRVIHGAFDGLENGLPKTLVELRKNFFSVGHITQATFFETTAMDRLSDVFTAKNDLHVINRIWSDIAKSRHYVLAFSFSTLREFAAFCPNVKPLVKLEFPRDAAKLCTSLLVSVKAAALFDGCHLSHLRREFGGLTRASAKHGPVHIGPQIFTLDASDFLNVRAQFNRGAVLAPLIGGLP